MKLIPLTRGKFAKVDDADFDWLNQFKWRAVEKCKNFYAVRHLRFKGVRKTVGIHQLLSAVMGFSRPDHKDGDGLNNQRHNLRRASKSENGGNRKLNCNSRSGFKGVYWNAESRKWRASIRKDGKSKYLGDFLAAEDAAHAYDAAAIKLFGEFARLNFPLVNKNT